MAQQVEITPDLIQSFREDMGRRDLLGSEYRAHLTDGMSARKTWDDEVSECLRMREGVPSRDWRAGPVDGYSPVEVTVGGAAADSLHAQVLSYIFSIDPIVTVRGRSAKEEEVADAMQDFVKFAVEHVFNTRRAAEHSFADTIDLGTGVFFIPWVRHYRRHRMEEIGYESAKILSIAPENLVVPAGAIDDPDLLPWISHRYALTINELKYRKANHGWKIDNLRPMVSVPFVQSERELLGRTARPVPGQTEVYEIFDVHAYYDWNEDGYAEDLLFSMDPEGNIAKVGWNPYERRPYEVCRYQVRPHMFYGVGVLSMIKPFEEALTNIFNYRMINLYLSNCRMWQGPPGLFPSGTVHAWPGRYLPVSVGHEIKELRMADIYNSSIQVEQELLALAERRVGVSELTSPGLGQSLNTRAPGITMISMLQQFNRRFTSAFDSMRMALAGAVKQCLYRTRERLLLEDQFVEENLKRILRDRAKIVIEALKDPNFDEGYITELTASSERVNRAVERQEAIILMNALVPYYQKIAEIAISVMGRMPGELAISLSKHLGDLVKRTARTFEHTKDAEALIIDLESILQQIASQGGSLNGTPSSSLAVAGSSPIGTGVAPVVSGLSPVE